MKDEIDKLIKYIDFDEIVKIINLIGKSENIKHIFIKNIDFNNKIYSIKKDELYDVMNHKVKIETSIKCDDNRELIISLYTDYNPSKAEYNLEEGVFKIIYKLSKNNLLLFHMNINKLDNFLQNKSNTSQLNDILYYILGNITISDLINNKMRPKYFENENNNEYIDLSLDFKPIEFVMLKENIRKKINSDLEYSMMETYNTEKDKIDSLIKDNNYNFNQITIGLLNDLKNTLIKKKEIILKELGISDWEVSQINNFEKIQNTINNELNNSKYSKEELSILYNYLQETIKRIERRQANNQNKTLVKTQK